MVVNDNFIHELGLDPLEAAWTDTQRDLVRAYGTGAWLTLAFQRVKAPQSTFAAG